MNPDPDGPVRDDPPTAADVRADRPTGVGVVTAERAGLAVIGGTLVLAGLRRRSLGGAALAAAGGWLAYRSIRGSRPDTGATVADASVLGSDDTGAPADAVEVERSVTVGRPAEELHEMWRDPDQLARIMAHFADVSPAGENRQHWEVRGPLGRVLAWDSRIVKDRPGELVEWESLPGATVPNEGSVRFDETASERGTEVTVRFRFDPPGGPAGDAAMEVLDVVPETIAEKSLDRFKSLAETGEIPTLEKNPSARGKGDLF
ncbi:SRPBCC family protein [Halostella sp. JP-L12]|uniref:SRPBCC family protein n=1 Tax=Halostella TaxID=1843185 RepID=UPI000EF7B746|nr:MULTISPECIES: SRPBCC family protein [Halostella]NHN47486.1 SRPBCC family protein [Halostella sp. JP-L12]